MPKTKRADSADLKIDDAKAAHLYRLAQAEELLLRFAEANGRPATTRTELDRWVSGAELESPVRPRPELLGYGVNHLPGDAVDLDTVCVRGRPTLVIPRLGGQRETEAALDGYLARDLLKVLRADGVPLWDGADRQALTVRAATAAEAEHWWISRQAASEQDEDLGYKTWLVCVL
jgi:hypothetical protein